MNNNNSLGLIILGIFISIGLAASGYFASQALYNAKMINTAEAKGLATRRVEANVANWSLNFSVEGKEKSEVPELYKKAESQQQIIANLLKQNGLKDDEINIGTIDYSYEEFRDDKKVLVDTKHTLTGKINVETNNVHIIAKVRNKLNKLIMQGIDITNHSPSYLFTDLNKIKPEMLKEATKNARIAANEFASNAGITVKGIKSARQGGFIIRDAGENYGDRDKIQKEVRVVTNIEFWLSN